MTFQVSIYTDDTVHYSFSSSVAVLKDTLNTDLAMVADWLNMNNLNLQKSKLIITDSERKNKSDSLSVQVMGNGISEDNHFLLHQTWNGANILRR